MTVTHVQRNSNDDLVSLGSFKKLKMPDMYTFDSRSEAVCAMVLEKYVKDWKTKRGENWQVPLAFGKTADFRVANNIIEFHPIELKNEFKDTRAYLKYKTAIDVTPKHISNRIEEALKQEKLKLYYTIRRDLIDNTRDLHFCNLYVCQNSLDFSICVANIINRPRFRNAIEEHWNHLFETI